MFFRVFKAAVRGITPKQPGVGGQVKPPLGRDQASVPDIGGPS